MSLCPATEEKTGAERKRELPRVSQVWKKPILGFRLPNS